MTALVFEIRGPEQMSGPDLLLHLFGDVFAGQLLPVHLPEGPTRAAAERERPLESAMATVYEGPPATFEWAEATRAGRSDPVWCALVAPLPFGGRPTRQPWLRSGLPPRARPLITARMVDDALRLRFGVGGAPLLPPPKAPSVWAEAARGAAREFGRSLRGALEGGARITLAPEDLSAGALEALVADLGAGPELRITPPRSRAPVLATRPGPCRLCRHANHGTFDLETDGLLACGFAGAKDLASDPKCDVQVEVEGRRGYAFEPFDGGNCTWGQPLDMPWRPPRS